MSRFLFEFEDQKWFPDFLRTYMTDYLQFIFSRLNMYKPVLPILHELLTRTSTNTIVDTCSGSGGPLFALKKEYEYYYDSPLIIRLTDKYIPLNIVTNLPDGITYEKTPLDADNIPQNVTGLRTMFSSMHHFRTQQIEKILFDAVSKNQPLVFFDSGNKSILMIISIILLHPIGLFLFTPFIKPFSFSRLLLTYVIPLIIFFTIWDGVISIINLHNEKDLKSFVNKEKFSSYHWSIGTLRNKFGMKIVYISGISNKL